MVLLGLDGTPSSDLRSPGRCGRIIVVRAVNEARLPVVPMRKPDGGMTGG
jgi:hypothetical protein